MKKLVATLAMVVLLTVGGIAPAEASVVRDYAHQLHCKHIKTDSMAGPANHGVHCKVNNKAGKQLIYVLKYNNVEKGIRFWRNWIGEGNYINRKGKVLVVTQGNHGVGGDWGYTLKWAKYIKRHIGGKIIEGR